MRKYLLLLALACLTGCGTAHTLVLSPKSTPDQYARIQVIADKPNVEVPAEIGAELESVIKQGLAENGAFATGDDLQVIYTFISYNPGSRAARYVTGGLGNSGEGSVAVQVRYVDRAGKEIARTQVEGHIGSGFFGGSIDGAVSKVGKEIVSYTVQQFSKK